MSEERFFLLKFSDGYFMQAPVTIGFLVCAREFIDCEIRKLEKEMFDSIQANNKVLGGSE
ncbi:MAG: hypothetical protein A4E30_00298 [Methanomassiliicoccales archaeon PtaB.Bin215]|nr:MAG: hypothetical protein A4E30_00298 [Methanomassiliicoccales archaeon PtaB.Bin215]